jgi:hypothetical protein
LFQVRDPKYRFGLGPFRRLFLARHTGRPPKPPVQYEGWAADGDDPNTVSEALPDDVTVPGAGEAANWIGGPWRVYGE